MSHIKVTVDKKVVISAELSADAARYLVGLLQNGDADESGDEYDIRSDLYAALRDGLIESGERY